MVQEGGRGCCGCWGGQGGLRYGVEGDRTEI